VSVREKLAAVVATAAGLAAIVIDRAPSDGEAGEEVIVA